MKDLSMGGKYELELSAGDKIERNHWILCNRGMPWKLKQEFYRMAIKAMLLYGPYCWAFRKDHGRKMEVVEMQMLWWMGGHTLRNNIQNEGSRHIGWDGRRSEWMVKKNSCEQPLERIYWFIWLTQYFGIKPLALLLLNNANVLYSRINGVNTIYMGLKALVLLLTHNFMSFIIVGSGVALGARRLPF